MTTTKLAVHRGFTLIELMVTVGIIAILSSIAIPNFQRMNMRAKSAERRIVLRAIQDSVEALRVKEGSWMPSGVAPAPVVGSWNPPLPTSTSAQIFNLAAANWVRLDLAIEGRCYYSYQFVADESANPPYYLLQIQGDADGNGQVYAKAYTYEIDAGAFRKTAEVPPADPVFDSQVF